MRLKERWSRPDRATPVSLCAAAPGEGTAAGASQQAADMVTSADAIILVAGGLTGGSCLVGLGGWRHITSPDDRGKTGSSGWSG